MSEVLVIAKFRYNFGGGYNTEVSVDGKLAYYTRNYPDLEKQNLDKLLKLMVIENVRVVVVP